MNIFEQDPQYEKYYTLQKEMAKRVIAEDQNSITINLVAGIDVAYDDNKDIMVAAVTLFNNDTGELLEIKTHWAKAIFPYVPGLFSFRELPPALEVMEQLSQKPDLIICDAHGIAHPRRFGFACHLGVETDIATIGCGKKRLIGDFVKPEGTRGSYSYLIDKNEKIGCALTTQDNLKPVFVSQGHKISLETSIEFVLKFCTDYRLPETTRASDHAVRMAMKKINE